MKRILCLILCAVMLCGMIGVSASAEGTLKMNFESVTAKAGETVQMAVTLENNPGITGFSGKLTYDKNALSYKASTGFTGKTDKGTWDNTGASLMWYYDGIIWDEDEEEILVYDDSYTGTEFFVLTFTVKEDAAPGAYEVTVEIDPEYDGIVDKDNNTIEDYEIVAGTVTITGEEPQVLADGYYLIGQKGWTVEDIDPEQKFETNPNNTEEFLLETGLAVGDGIKVVKVENGAITAWYPDGVDNQYVVDEAHAGRKTIYFHPWYADGWSAFGGYIWIDGALTVGVEVYGSSVSLKGSVALNFFLIVPEELLEDEGLYVKLDETVYLVSAAPTRTVGEYKLYQFTVLQHAKQMNDKVTLRVYTGSDEIVPLYRHSNGENLTETGYVYSVQDYIQKTLNTSSDEKLKALVQAMSDYGSLAQAQFNYNTEQRAEVKGDLDSVTAESIASYESVVTTGTATGLEFKGATLVLEAETTIRLYFTLQEGEISDYTFKQGTKVLTPVATSDGCSVDIPNISAKDLDKTFTVKVTSGEGTVVTVKYSALSYAYGVLSKGTTGTLADLVKGLVLYNKAADAYFG